MMTLRKTITKVNLEIVTHVAKKFMKKDPFYVGGLKYATCFIGRNSFAKQTQIEDTHEELNEKREKDPKMKLDMYRRASKVRG